MAEQVTITLKTTAAKSPRSNGMVVRHNGISAKTIKKLILDSNNKYSMDAVIAWAVNAKNSQLVFGHNLSLPSFLVNDLPAMEESASDLLRKHLNVLSELHKTFLECEAN